jgi:uncharacterized protein (DUF58 family)
VFGLLALIQLVMAISSQNNLIYLFVFGEISVALASMFFTNYNIQKVNISDVSTDFCFSEEDNWVTVFLKTRKQKPSYQLMIRWSSKKEDVLIPPSVYQVQIPWRPHRRGRQRIPKLTLESTFPFGLLRAWKIEYPNHNVIVYPARRGDSAFPATSVGDRDVQQHGLFYDLRPFQRGDSPQRIDWRASQRSQQLLIRRFEEEASVKLDFHWSHVSQLQKLEDKICQLALWIDLAEKQGASYSLEIGNWMSGSGQGTPHWSRCMEYLALLEGDES